MSDFKAKMRQVWFWLGLCPWPRWGSFPALSRSGLAPRAFGPQSRCFTYLSLPALACLIILWLYMLYLSSVIVIACMHCHVTQIRYQIVMMMSVLCCTASADYCPVYHHAKTLFQCWCRSSRLTTICPSSRKRRTRSHCARWPTLSMLLIVLSCQLPLFRWVHSFSGSYMLKAGYSVHFLLATYAPWLV